MNLFTLTRTKYRIGLAIRIGIFLLLPYFSYSQTYVGVSSNPADNGSLTTATVTVTPVTGMVAGDLAVIYAHTRANSATFTLSTTGGQSWHQETTWSANLQATTVFWCRYNGNNWPANPVVSGGTAGTPTTAVMYAFRPTNAANSWAIYSAALNAAPGSATNITITGFTTLIPNTVTMGFWGSPDDVTWGGALAAGWAKPAAQYRNTGGSDQSQTAAYNLRPTAGIVNNVTQTQSAAQQTRTTRISWMEIAPPSNDLCSGAINLTPGACPAQAVAGTLVGATWTNIPTIGCGVAERSDVWYSFVAPVTNPTITLSSPPTNARLQLFSGSCAGLTSVSCGNTSIAATGLTIGDTYYVRVYTNPNFPGTGGTFNICVSVPVPSNNACSNAITLNSAVTCNNTAGYVFGATNEGPSISNPNCATGVTYDVWYRFMAQRTNPTITLSNIGSNFTNASLQLLSGACGGLTPLFCGGTSIAANYLTPGTNYYIRVYSTGTAPTNAANTGFDICVTDPSDPPSNDECSGAVNLAVTNTCSNNPGNMAGATPSSQPLGGSCTGPNAYDVWYRFAAVGNATTTITLSSLGANFTNPGIEVFSGRCTGTLTSIACGTGLALTTPVLMKDTVYYIRVYSRTGPPPNGNARFNICLVSNAAPVVRFGNSYVNISKKTTGGVVEPGDTLEIRMTINHTAAQMYNLRYVDNIPGNTAMLTGPTDRIRIITNEGLIYKEFTLAGGDDAATYNASPPGGQYNIRMNLAFGTSSPGIPANNTATEYLSADGSMSNSNRPRGGSGLLFATAYRVVVNGSIGDTVTLNPGRFIYRTAADGGTEVTLTATPFRILISEPLNLCSNSIGVNNATEYGGTFGSGTTLNRSTDLTTPIPGYSFLNDVNAYNGLGDGRYAIVKNISPRSGTATNANRVGVPGCGTLAFDDELNCAYRMHGGHWDIDGDHTGTYNAAGNAPPSFAQNAGYMLMVNADYVASEVFSQTINNLCPNTYYEFSAWFRNICETCGWDSTGAQFNNPPTAPPEGYPGVFPNLSFALDGLDYYSTGEIPLTGWLKKGFVFRTDSNQVSATFSIRNNSQGGGGNDWVMDDIAVATCLPTMSYSPTINPNVCQANAILIADTISSYFNNYTTFKWQRSTDGGANWTDITGVTSLPDTNYYITTYTVPPSATTLADSGNLYRVVVATTPDNLVDPNCNISDGVTITLSVLDCGAVLNVNLLSFNGRLVESKGQLFWTTSQEDAPVTYLVERSPDGRNFSPVGQVPGYNNGNTVNHYSLTDPQGVADKMWYRVIIITADGKRKHSSIIQLKNSLPDFELTNIVNPFGSTLAFEIAVTNNSAIRAELIDISGKTVLTTKQLVYTGSNSIVMTNTGSLPAGIYTLRVVNKDKFITKRVVKKN